jgi:hypothetical protein
MNIPNIRFYDNEMANWENDMGIFRKQIEFIHVDEETPNPFSHTTTKKTKISEKNKEYITAYNDYWISQNNSYAIYSRDIPIKSQSKIVYPNLGINVRETIQWALLNNGPKIVLSDWDRTITVCEGMLFNGEELLANLEEDTYIGDHVYSVSQISKPIKFQDLLVYMMGGEERLQQLREMFRTFQKQDISFFVLTNNPNASKTSANRVIYLRMMSALMPWKTIDELDNMLYSSKDTIGYKKHKSTCAIEMVSGILDNCREMNESSIAPFQKSHSKTSPTGKKTRKRKNSESGTESGSDSKSSTSSKTKPITKRKKAKTKKV